MELKKARETTFSVENMLPTIPVRRERFNKIRLAFFDELLRRNLCQKKHHAKPQSRKGFCWNANEKPQINALRLCVMLFFGRQAIPEIAEKVPISALQSVRIFSRHEDFLPTTGLVPVEA